MAEDAYLWIKAVHVIAVISWMAGLLYLPRLFVYHCGVETSSPASEMLIVMERRLYRAIMMPAMLLTVATGLWLLFGPEVIDFSEGWVHAKILLVVLLLVAHFLMARWRTDFAAGRNRRGDVFYRVANEVPTVLMIGIVILVIVRPF